MHPLIQGAIRQCSASSNLVTLELGIMSDRVARLLHKGFQPDVEWQHEAADTRAWYVEAAAAAAAAIRFKDQEAAQAGVANANQPLRSAR
jgi:hypothetical protein